MTFCYVSCFYEISDGITKRRSVDKYVEHISYLHGLTSQHDVIFFTDTNMYERLIKLYPNFIYSIVEKESLPIWNKIVNSDAERISGGFDTTSKPYSAITITKPYFITEAKKLRPDYDHYVWMDAAISSHSAIPYSQLEESLILSDKIILVQMRSIHDHEREGLQLLSCNRGIIAASIFIVPTNLTEFLWDKSCDAVSHMLEHKWLCLDEQVLAYINSKYPELFDYWYSDYNTPVNLRYITVDHDTVIRNMLCSSNQHACTVGIKLLESMAFTHTFPRDKIANVLFNLHIKSYYTSVQYKGIMLHEFVAKIIYYLKNKGMSFPTNILDNLKFSNGYDQVIPEIMPYVRNAM